MVWSKTSVENHSSRLMISDIRDFFYNLCDIRKYIQNRYMSVLTS